MVGWNPSSSSALHMEMNSRALCLVGPVCEQGTGSSGLIFFDRRSSARREGDQIRGANDAADGPVFRCFGMTTDGQVQSHVQGAPCESFFHEHVVKAGTHHTVHPESWLAEQDLSKMHWDIQHANSLVMLVPHYPYVDNIFHVARALLFGLHVVLNKQIVNELLLASQPNHVITAKSSWILARWRVLFPLPNSWMINLHALLAELLEAVDGMPPRAISHKISSSKAHKDPLTCYHRAIVLGKEGDFDAMMFLNDSAVQTLEEAGREAENYPLLTRDQLIFKAHVYETLRTRGDGQQLPKVSKLTGNQFRDDVTLHVTPPPLSVIYILRSELSKRVMPPDIHESLVHRLDALCKSKGVTFRAERFEKKSFKEQVRMMRSSGLVIGIHGANLVNTIFMPPLSAVLEIFPFHYKRRYYLGGSNSGVYYSDWEVTNGHILPCDPGDGSTPALKCRLAYRSVPLNLSTFDLDKVLSKASALLDQLLLLHRSAASSLSDEQQLPNASRLLPLTVRGRNLVLSS
ncbi:hypothetical protein FVE85_2201 [Porphyridium purpureum]|uniref:Glycosyltransferase 61 catalytic domain-containing protein n=1 Tax=Porphyridium purpureum TaxID=35688 RepID=A0A5J4YXH3_PORPP|nr:hypothetical protein FVE85_2201 [Porphyridium purpureum]|eukprot:POR5290..scf209_3